MSAASKLVADALSDPDAIRKSRLHPMAILVAQSVYGSGHGLKGKLSWTPVPQVTMALERAFYHGFANIEPTGKNWLLGIDVSGSMSWGSPCAGNLSCAQVAAAMAMVTMRSEQNWYCHGFADTFRDLGLRADMTLREVLLRTHDMNFGSTDCALPMVYALQNRIPVDTFVVYTDNETGSAICPIHVHQALRQYRDAMNPKAKLIVMGITATGFTIADPNDAGMLDVVGFDTSAPSVMADFARG
jgi:60 kDa SS-A/Ro ribonucleoprotein